MPKKDKSSTFEDERQILLIGNTHIKLGPYPADYGSSGSGEGCLKSPTIYLTLQTPPEKLIEIIPARKTLVISVMPAYTEALKRSHHSQNIVFWDNQIARQKFRLEGLYHTIGVDRIAGLVGAINLRPQESQLLVDLGTFTTVTLLEYADQTYQLAGGLILPGLGLGLKSVHLFSQSLPEVNPELLRRYALNPKVDMISHTTEEAICKGQLYHAKALLKGLVRDYPGYTPWLTGGWASLLVPVADDYHFEPNLVLRGGICYTARLD